MKRLKRLILCGLVIAMSFCTINQNIVSSIALENKQVSSEDYSDTTKQKDVETLDVDMSKVGDLINFNNSPLYDVENNELLLPRMKGYKVEVFGSDNKPTVSLDGKVTRPLTTQTVKLLYKITNESDNSVVTTEKNAIIKIPGKEVQVTGNNAKPSVIPGIREWIGGEGKINLDSARIVLGSEKFQKAAETFKADYQDLTGRTINIVNGDKNSLKAGDIYLGEVDDPMLGKEGYYMNIGGDEANKDYVEITATHNTGALYGTITILQILKQDSGCDDLSRGLVKDYPLFEQRGMMFDVARKWIPMYYLEDLTKQMSWYKLNMMSIHLSDNDIWDSLSTVGGTEPEGWFRLESETFPELTSEDHYTKEEFRNYQLDSMDLGIDVIPELDTPGHALAYTKVWPDCVATGTDGRKHPKYLDVKNPKTLANVKKMYDEYIDGYNGGKPTFVGEYVNIGTDEYKGFGDQTTKEAFRKYCNDLLEYIESKGKEPVFWGSLKENSGTTEVMTDATMFAWYQGYADAKKSLDAGYNIISMEDLEVYIVPGGGWYSYQFGRAEHLYNNWVPNNNTGWVGQPAPDGHPRMMGGQFAVWNDFHGNGISVNDISYRIQHNLYTIATKCWNGNQIKTDGYSYNDLKKLADTLGDAPNADFMYEVDKNVKKNELLKLDDTVTNQVAENTGAEILKYVNIDENVAGKNGNALQFKGNDSYISTDIKSPGFDWTAGMWIKPDVDNPENTVLMEGKTGVLRLEDGKIKYDVEQYTHTFDCNIANDQWTHVTLTGTFEGVSLYVNGTLVDTLAGKPYPNYNVNSNCNSWTGDYPTNENGQTTQRYYQTLMLPMETIGSKTNAVKATIDELVIYNKVLSQSEIEKLVGTETVTYQNVALDKTVEVGNYHSATTEGNRSGQMAVDGDLETRWEFNINDTSTNFIKVPLNSDEDVNKVVIKQMVWVGANRIQDIRITAVNGEGETEVLAKTAYTVNTTDEANKLATTIVELGKNVKADAIKIYLTPKAAGVDDLVNIREVELYGTKEYEENPHEEPVQEYTLVPQSTMSATATSEHTREGEEGLASMAIDGNPSTMWHSNWAPPAAILPQSITIDMNALRTIGKYTYLPRSGAGNGTISQYTLEVSTDGQTFTEVSSGNWNVDVSLKEVVFTPRLARYVRLTAVEASNGNATAAELNVYEAVIASKESLQTLISQVEGLNLDAYIEGSDATLNTAIDDAKVLLEGTPTQEQFNKAIEDIKKGLLALEVVGDKTALEELYNEHINIDSTLYAQDSYDQLKAKLDEAKTIIDSADQAGQNTLNNLIKEIQELVKGLVNLTDLRDYIQVASAIDVTDATPTTGAELTKQLANAKAVESNAAATANQAEIAVYRLSIALEDLVADDTALSTLIDSYKEASYTASSWQEFSDDLDVAKAVLEKDYTIDDLTQARLALLEAQDVLVLKADEASINLLKEKVEAFGKLNPDDYVKDSWDGYVALINQAKDLLKDVENIDVATITQLLDKIETYVLETVVYDVEAAKNKLKDLIAKFELDQEKYTVSSWKEFSKTLEEVKKLVTDTTDKTSTKEELIKYEKATDDLLKASSKLVLRGHTTQLEALVNSYNVNQESYTKASYDLFIKHLDIAKKAIADSSDLSQEQIDKIKKDLIDAFSKLEKVALPDLKPVEKPDEKPDAKPNEVETNDSTQVMGYIVMGILAIGLCGAIVYSKKKKNKDL